MEGGFQHTDLLTSDLTEFQIEQQTITKFRHAFDLYQQMIEEILKLPKLEKEQQEYLFKMIDNIGSSGQLFDIFVNFKDQRIPLSISKHIGRTLDELKKIDFGQATKIPENIPNVIQKLNQLKRKLQDKIIERESVKTDDIVMNKYNSLLQQIISATPDQKSSILSIINEQENIDYEQTKARLLTIDGKDSQKLLIVEEYYKYRKEMLTRFFDFCNKLEKKLIDFIKNFGKDIKVESYVKNIKAQYEKFKIIISDLVANGIVDNQDGIQQEINAQLTPSYTLQEFQEKMQKLGTAILKDYTKDDRFSKAMEIVKQINGLEITQDQVLFDLIIPSIIFSQIKLDFNQNMTNQQFQKVINNDIYKLICMSDTDILSEEERKPHIQQFRQYLTQFLNICTNLIKVQARNITQEQQFIQNNVQQYRSIVVVRQNIQNETFAQIRDHIIDLWQLLFPVVQFNNQNIQQQIQSLSSDNTVQIIFSRNRGLVNNNIVLGNVMLKFPQIQFQQNNKVIQDIQHRIQNYGVNALNGFVIQDIIGSRDNIYTIAVGNLYLQNIGLERQQYDDIINSLGNYQPQNQNNPTDKGLILQYITNKEDIVMKLTSQAIDAIYSTLLISLQAIQTSPTEMSIVQIIGGAKENVIQGAEIFYNLFAAATLVIRNHFKDNEGVQLNLKINLPYESKFKKVFEFIIPRQQNISQPDFQEYIGMLNKIWNSSNENGSKTENGINQRTRILLQQFMNDLMKGLTFSFGQSEQNKIGLQNIQVYKDIVQTAGFEENFTNINNAQDNAYVEKIFQQIPKYAATFNDKYQQLIKILENMILNQEDVSNYDDKEFSYYVKQYYNNVNYQEKARERYVYDEYNKFVQNMLEGKMANTFTPTFITEFGLLYYYYLTYVSNIMKILEDYHKQIVDDRVLKQEYPYKQDLSDLDDGVVLPIYQQPLFQAFYASIHGTKDSLFQIFNELIQYEVVGQNQNGDDITFNNQGLQTQLSGLNIQQKFYYLLENYGMFKNVSQEIKQKKNKGDLYPERLDYIWQQYQFITVSREKQIAYMLNYIMTDDIHEIIRGVYQYGTFQRFINLLKKNKLFNQLFKPINETTPKIGKIVITLCSRRLNVHVAPQIGDDLPNVGNGYADTMEQWTGEDNGKAYLCSNTVGLHDQCSRKYYLQEDYEQLLINWFYPDYIYPKNLEDHVMIQKKITEQIPLVKYNDKGFDAEPLIKFLKETEEKIMQNFGQFSNENQTLKTYYTTQLQQSIDVSGMIKSIFNKKIIPPCDIQLFKQNYMKLQPINYENDIKYKFIYDDNGEVYPDLFTYENTYNQEIVGMTMPGMEKKAVPIRTKTYFCNKIETEGDKHSDVIFEINEVNRLLHNTLQAFSCQGAYKKLPKDLVEKFLYNKYLKEQVLLKEVKHRDFLLNIPANGFHTPFSLPNINLENPTIEQVPEELLHGGGVKRVQTSEQYNLLENENMILRSDIILINTCLKLLGEKDEKAFFKNFKKPQRLALYQKVLDEKILPKKDDLINDGNLLMGTAWNIIEKSTRGNKLFTSFNSQKELDAFNNIKQQINITQYIQLFLLGYGYVEFQQTANIPQQLLDAMNRYAVLLNLNIQIQRSNFGNIVNVNGVSVFGLLQDQIFKQYYRYQPQELRQQINSEMLKYVNRQIDYNNINVDYTIDQIDLIIDDFKILNAILQQRLSPFVIKMLYYLCLRLSRLDIQDSEDKQQSYQLLLEGILVVGRITNDLGLGSVILELRNNQDIDAFGDLQINMNFITKVAQYAVQTGLIDFKITTQQNNLLMLASLLNKLQDNTQYNPTTENSDPLYVVQGTQIDYFQQTYQKFDFQIKDINKLESAINNLQQILSQTDKYDEIRTNILLYNNNNIHKKCELYFNSVKYTNIPQIQIQPVSMLSNYFVDDVIDQDYIPSVQETIMDYKLMSYCKIIISFIDYLLKFNITHELIYNRDLIVNQINTLNSRQALNPRLQGQSLSHFVDLSTQNKLDLNLLQNQLQYRIVRQIQDGGQGFYTNANICLVFVDEAHRTLHQQYNRNNPNQIQQQEQQYVYNQNQMNQLQPWNTLQQQQQLIGGVKKSREIYQELNNLDARFFILDFQQGGVPNQSVVNHQLLRMFINIQVPNNTVFGKLVEEANAKRIKNILFETSQQMFIFNEKKQQLEKYTYQKNILNEFYKGKIIHMSNAYALNKTNDQQYTLLDRQTITNEIIKYKLKDDIQNVLQYYAISEQAKSILQTIQNIVLDFMKENYQLLKTDKEYVRMYDEYSQQYLTRMQNPEEMFNLELITKDTAQQQDRFNYWMSLEADYYIEDEDIKVNDKFSQFKKIWSQLRKLNKIKKIPFQKAKMFFTRYTDEANRYIGYDHYFTEDSGLHNIIQYRYIRNITEPTNRAVALQGDELLITQKSNLNQLFKLQTSEIQNISEQMHQLIRYNQLGLASFNGLTKFDMKLPNLVKTKNIQLKSLQQNQGNINLPNNLPFELYQNNIGSYNKIFDINANIQYLQNVQPDHVFLYNMLYNYRITVNGQQHVIEPLPLIVHLQMHSGISEPEITRSATTFGISVFPMSENADEQKTLAIQYFTQLNSCLQNKSIQMTQPNKQVQLNKVFKIIGINPINAISLIKNNLSFPTINILSLFLRSYMRNELKGKQNAVQGNTREYVFQKYINEDYDFALQGNNIIDIIPKQNVLKKSNRYLQHMISNSALFLIKAKEKRIALNQQYQLQNYKITIDSKQDIDF